MLGERAPHPRFDAPALTAHARAVPKLLPRRAALALPLGSSGGRNVFVQLGCSDGGVQLAEAAKTFGQVHAFEPRWLHRRAAGKAVRGLANVSLHVRPGQPWLQALSDADCVVVGADLVMLDEWLARIKADATVLRLDASGTGYVTAPPTNVAEAKV